MSLKFKILDEDDSAVVEKGRFRFFSGEDRTLKLQVFESFDGDEREIAAGGTIEVTLPGYPDSITKSGTIQATRSIVIVDLSTTDTTSMVSGNITGEIDEGGNKRIVMSEFVLKKLTKVPD